MRHRHYFSIMLFGLAAFANTCHADELPHSHRYATLASNFLPVKKAEAAPVTGANGPVLVLFRINDAGHILNMRPNGGTPEMQQSAEAALKQWMFKPSFVMGQPAQMDSAVVFDFSNGVTSTSAPGMMSAAELSPDLGFQCPNALAHREQNAVDACKNQLDKTVQDYSSTDMENFTAHDEYGLALLYAKQPKPALEQFNLAIQLAPKGLTSSDDEWAYVCWHRGAAEQALEMNTEAARDLFAAEESLKLAKANAGKLMDGYFQGLMDALSKQLAQISSFGQPSQK